MMIKFNIETKLPEVVKLKNTNRFLIEGWIFGSSRIKNLSVYVGKQAHQAEHMEMYRPEVANDYFAEDPDLFSMFSGFSVPVIIEPASVSEEREVILTANFRNGEQFTHNLGTVKLHPWTPHNSDFPLPQGVIHKDLLVICMATYNPNEPQFVRQVESIIKQDYTNWVCIVSDDCSTEDNKKYMRDILVKDARFLFVENQENVGFYHNFERCLELVPSSAKYIALSDQDDYWYPNKLSECIKKLVGTTQLVYCDMRIVHENGTVFSETYWNNRKNYYKSEDIDLLAIANTVTGAASVFRASLLEKTLPFPPRYGNVFHDQWIALIAATTGGIDYVDAPLYDYMQSTENIIGHTDFERTSIIDYLRENIIWKSYQQNVTNLSFKNKTKSFIRHFFLMAKETYYFQHGNGRHISTLIETFSVRNVDSRANLLVRRPLSILGLLKMHTKIFSHKETTNNIELSLLFSRVINILYSYNITLLRKLMLKKITNHRNINNTCIPTQERTETCNIDPGISEFKRKFSGRKFVVVNKKQHVNFLLSRLDPSNFFGGYIGMINFAKKFSEIGYSVRVVLTDQSEIPDEDLRKIQDHDLKLKKFFTNAEYLTAYSSETSIPITENDIFVATSWWTAHIAHEAVSHTKYAKFIYLEQDYEPIFYEHGAYRILAEMSYKFNFYPVFSTDILQKYFIETGVVSCNEAGEYFNNPVLNFNLGGSSLPLIRKGKKKLLFYGRPQPHNARNLYPIGCLAIDRARELGYFKEDEWEVVSIGGDIGDQVLPSGIKVKHIGKFDIEKYKELLPQHDLGLALMDSPHPSLLPIEMASAGLLVVTNTYGIKNREYFSHISGNISAVSPDHESLAQALIEESKKVDDLEKRVAGSKINWPHEWDDALPVSIIEKAVESVMKSTVR